ncbi:MAG: hypothetical protein C0594_03660 [Marinilabiliales bacterium]|nr:MAG: hypothetical protein C0594_03660 [Marinilabiliales bacterium]
MSQTNYKILVVDDNSENVFLHQAILEEEGYNVITAAGGVAALEMVEREAPDLILLDIMMPYVDGFDVLKKIINNEKTTRIPVIMISSLYNEHFAEAKRIGAVDYIEKPVDIQMLISKVSKAIKNKN